MNDTKQGLCPRESSILGWDKQYAPSSILEDEDFQRSKELDKLKGIWEQMKGDGWREGCDCMEGNCLQIF